jgi:hypothetical protein
MPVLDLTYGRPELVAVRDAVAKADPAALSAALADGVIGGEDRADRVQLAARLLVAAAGKDVPTLAERLVEAHAEAPGVLALRGAVEVLCAWEIRGTRRAALTQNSRLRGFVEVLADAEQYCRDASRLFPEDPTPWVWLLNMSRGQGVNLEERLTRWTELMWRAPDYFYGHYYGVMALSPLWGCPPEVMYECIRPRVAAAPAGSLLPALLLAANIEQWRVRSDPHDAMFKNKALLAEAEQAASRLPMQPCSTPSERMAHTYALAWFVKAKQWKLANRHKQLVGTYCVPDVWINFGPAPLAAFRSFRVVTRYPFLGY